MRYFILKTRLKRRREQFIHAWFLIRSLTYTLFRVFRYRFQARWEGKLFVAIGLVNHIGDIIACEPVARYVRETVDDCDLYWVVERQYQSLLSSHPSLTGTIPVLCFTEWRILLFIGVFDRVYDLHVGGKVCYTCGIHFPKEGPNLEDYYFAGSLLKAFSKGAGLPPIDVPPKLFLPTEVAIRSTEYGLNSPYVVFHTESNDNSRTWSNEAWDELGGRLLQRGIQVVEIGIHPRVSAAQNLCGSLSLQETGAVIRNAAVFVGIDSGPAHIANAVATPGVILLGNYRHFGEYMPYSGDYASGANATIIRAKAVNLIPVDDVFEAVLRQIQRRVTPNELTI